MNHKKSLIRDRFVGKVSMAQYKIQDPDELIPCPLDKTHRVLAKGMHYHLIDCKKNFRPSDIETCPFNAGHVMPKPELKEHLPTCQDKAAVEAMMAYEYNRKNGLGDSMFRGCIELPVYEDVVINSEENWDDEIPPVARIGVDLQFFARQDHMIIPGLSRSEKKEFARQMHYPVEERKFVSNGTAKRVTGKNQLGQGQKTPTTAQTNVSQQKKSIQGSSAVFAYSLSMVGIGRGRSVKKSSPPSLVECSKLQEDRVNGKQEKGIEDWNKQLKKIEKKLRQIEPLEEKVKDGQALTTDEASKFSQKNELMKERDDLQMEMEI